MQVTASTDIQAPIDFVFGQISDFPAFERQALRRGADVNRLPGGPGLGTAWDIRFQFRGKERTFRATITRFDPAAGITVQAISASMDVVSTFDVVALSPSTTRLTVAIDTTARALSARLLLQSLKLIRGALTKRLETGLTDFARDVQGRHERRRG